MKIASRSILVLLLLAVIVPATASAAKKTVAPKGPEPAHVKIQVGHLRGGKAQIMSIVPVIGNVSPAVPGQKVDVSFYLNGKRIESKTLSAGSGSFRTRIRIDQAGKYAASAHLHATDTTSGDETVRKSWTVSFPGLHQGSCGAVTIGFKKAMRSMGYVANDGSCFGGKTARGVLAYRKVNDMTRSMRAGPGLVKSVFAGRGEYKVLHPNAGEHLEAPLNKQVLVFAKGDKPFAIYPISSGKPSTPTVTGHFTFIRTEPGYNSEGMYYAFYFYNGYAVHGYAEVPNYAASHGCLRTFIADQPEIFHRIHYGESIFVF